MLDIASPNDLAEDIQKLYQGGLPPGDSTGWPDVDPLYTVQTRYWTVITGVPSDGKSTWMDGVMLNLIENYGWKFIIYTPENQPLALYMAKLCEKKTHRPFRFGFANRLEAGDVAISIGELEDNLRLLRLPEDSKMFPDLNAILFAAQDTIEQESWEDEKVGLIIDPWNELDHTPLAGMNETQYTNFELMMYRHWIRQRNVHGWIITHPQKPARNKKGELQPVGLYDINGSAAWFNKCDHGIVIRRREDMGAIAEVDVQKCRFQHLGHRGTCLLNFNSGTGTYSDYITPAGRYQGEDDYEPPSY